MFLIVFSFACNHLKLRFESLFVSISSFANSPNLDQIVWVLSAVEETRTLPEPEL